MSRSVGNLKDSVAGILTGLNLNNVTNLNGALERAARTTVQMAKIPEATGRENVTLYDDVFDYTAPTTIFGGSMIDFRPKGNSRSAIDYVYRKPIEMFDRTKAQLPNGYMITFEHNKGSGIMRVSSPKPFPSSLLDGMNVTTGWTAAGSASNLTVDRTVYYEALASLKFTLTGASTGTLTKAITSVNISTYEDVGVAFLAIYAPNITNLTSITLNLGSSAGNINTVTSTAGFLGAWTSGDWLLVPFDFATATQTGTPDWTAIDYAQVSIITAGTITNFRVGRLFISLPSPHEIIYQSAAIFNVDGTLSNQITDDDDVIILGDSAYTIYEYESAKAVALQKGGDLAAPAVQMIDGILKGTGGELGLYQKYQADNPSEELRMVGNYYDDE